MIVASRHIKRIFFVDRRTWWDVARHCPYATFSHTPAWQDLACETYPQLRPATIGGVCRDGTRIILPLLKTAAAGKGLLHGFSSTFAGCYGGPIADGPVTARAIELLYLAAARQRTASLDVRGNPYAPRNLQPDWRTSRHQTDSTYILDLNKDYDAVRARFGRGHRNRINRGRRHGITVREGYGQEDYRRYYEVYQATLRRWGTDTTSVYPWRLFEAGARLADRYPANVRLRLAELDGQVIAGAWGFAWNGHFCGWHAASLPQYLRTGVNHLLQDRMIEFAMREGLRHYDFYPSGGHPGSDLFKAEFGATLVSLPRWQYQAPALRFLHWLHESRPSVPTHSAAG